MFAYATGSSQWDRVRELTVIAENGYQVVPERIIPINLTSHANRSFTDEVPTDGRGGWFDQGANDFRMMPFGKVEAAGVPFEIIDPAKNNGKSCLIVSGTERKYFPDAIRGIKVNRKFSRLFFLHTAAWGSQPDAGCYRIHYADGKSVDYRLNGNRNISDWWNPKPLPEAKVGIQRNNPQGVFVGAYVAEWINPRPKIEITSIDFLSPLHREKEAVDWLPTQTAVPALVALSGESIHTSPLEITGDSFRAIYGSKEVGSSIEGEVKERREDNQKVWDIHFPSSGAGKTPAAFFVFSTENNSGDYDFLTLEIKSDSSAEVHLLLPEVDWKKAGSTMLKLIGDGKYHAYRLRIARELAVDFPLKQLRGELFFFYRSAWGENRSRPPLDFTIRKAVLE